MRVPEPQLTPTDCMIIAAVVGVVSWAFTRMLV
jgi:hypothetical protein